MKRIIEAIDNRFEKFVLIALKIYAHSLTFIIACLVVVLYLFKTDFAHQSLHKSMGEVMTCVTFLIFFLVQKSVNRSSLALQIKLNELILSHDKASNNVVEAEHKTEAELIEIARKYRGNTDDDPGH